MDNIFNILNKINFFYFSTKKVIGNYLIEELLTLGLKGRNMGKYAPTTFLNWANQDALKPKDQLAYRPMMT